MYTLTQAIPDLAQLGIILIGYKIIANTFDQKFQLKWFRDKALCLCFYKKLINM